MKYACIYRRDIFVLQITQEITPTIYATSGESKWKRTW